MNAPKAIEFPEQHELLWKPDTHTINTARVTLFRQWLQRERGLILEDYEALRQWSVADLPGFWSAVAEYFRIPMNSRGDDVLGHTKMPGTEWFPGATLNYARRALAGDDGHGAQSPDDAVAIVAEDETGTYETWSRGRLREEVANLAAHLRAKGVRPGDRVVGYMPNRPEAVVAFLAAASVGAVWALCGPELGPASVIARFAQLEPVFLVASTRHTYNGRDHDRTAAVIELQAALPTLREVVLIGDEPLARTTPWARATTRRAAADTDPLDVAFDHPLWVLFSSGTTGVPKGIVHGHGGILLEHLKYLALHVDLGPGDRFLWYTSTSWMMWNVVTSGLTTGAAVVLYDGSPSHPGLDRLWEVAGRHNVTVLGTSAGYLTQCAKADLQPAQSADLSALRALHSTGSPLPVHAFHWARRSVGTHIPVISGSGGTDVATGFVGGTPVLPVYAGEMPGRLLGVDVQAWDDHAHSVVGQVGELIVAQPMPSMPLRFWADPGDERLKRSYFDTYPGIWRHGDWVELTTRGTVIVHGRSDSTLNRNGVRMGTAEIYRAVEALDEIHEALAIGVEEPNGSYWLPLFVVLRHGTTLDDQLRNRINDAIRRDASARHVPDEIVQVDGIPHTVTGKKLEVPVKRLLRGEAAGIDTDAVDNLALLTVFTELGNRHRETAAP